MRKITFGVTSKRDSHSVLFFGVHPRLPGTSSLLGSLVLFQEERFVEVVTAQISVLERLLFDSIVISLMMSDIDRMEMISFSAKKAELTWTKKKERNSGGLWLTLDG